MKRWQWLVVMGLLLAGPASVLAHSDDYGTGPGMMGWGWGHGMGWSWPMMIFMVFFWGLMIVGLIVLIRWLLFKDRAGTASPDESALDILKKRYARGEIDKAEYDEKKKALEE